MQNPFPTIAAPIPNNTPQKRPTILLVADFASFSGLIWCQLTALDYKVIFRSGESAGRDLLIERPSEHLDLLILDLNLPLARCRELAEAFRRENPDVRVLLLSTEANTVTSSRSIGFLQKPLLIENLGEHLRAFLEGDIEPATAWAR